MTEHYQAMASMDEKHNLPESDGKFVEKINDEKTDLSDLFNEAKEGIKQHKYVNDIINTYKSILSENEIKTIYDYNSSDPSPKYLELTELFGNNFPKISEYFEKLIKMYIVYHLQTKAYDYINNLHYCGGIAYILKILSHNYNETSTDKYVNDFYGKIRQEFPDKLQDNKRILLLHLSGNYFGQYCRELVGSHKSRDLFTSFLIFDHFIKDKTNLTNQPECKSNFINCPKLNEWFDKLIVTIDDKFINDIVNLVILEMKKKRTCIKRFRDGIIGPDDSRRPNQLNSFSLYRLPMFDKFIRLVIETLVITVYLDILGLVELDDLPCKTDTIKRREKITTVIPIITVLIHTAIMMFTTCWKFRSYYLKLNNVIYQVYNLGMIATLVSYFIYICTIFNTKDCRSNSEIVIDIFGVLFVYSKFQDILDKIDKYNEECKKTVGEKEYDDMQLLKLLGNTKKDENSEPPKKELKKNKCSCIKEYSVDLYISVVIIFIALLTSVIFTLIDD